MLNSDPIVLHVGDSFILPWTHPLSLCAHSAGLLDVNIYVDMSKFSCCSVYIHINIIIINIYVYTIYICACLFIICEYIMHAACWFPWPLTRSCTHPHRCMAEVGDTGGMHCAPTLHVKCSYCPRYLLNTLLIILFENRCLSRTCVILTVLTQVLCALLGTLCSPRSTVLSQVLCFPITLATTTYNTLPGIYCFVLPLAIARVRTCTAAPPLLSHSLPYLCISRLIYMKSSLVCPPNPKGTCNFLWWAH